LGLVDADDLATDLELEGGNIEPQRDGIGREFLDPIEPLGVGEDTRPIGASGAEQCAVGATPGWCAEVWR
jgi:hypothetical protein